MCLVGKKIIVESKIRYGSLNLCNFLCIFVRFGVRVRVCLMHVISKARVMVRVRFMVAIFKMRVIDCM